MRLSLAVTQKDSRRGICLELPSPPLPPSRAALPCHVSTGSGKERQAYLCRLDFFRPGQICRHLTICQFARLQWSTHCFGAVSPAGRVESGDSGAPGGCCPCRQFPLLPGPAVERHGKQLLRPRTHLPVLGGPQSLAGSGRQASLTRLLSCYTGGGGRG